MAREGAAPLLRKPSFHTERLSHCLGQSFHHNLPYRMPHAAYHFMHSCIHACIRAFGAACGSGRLTQGQRQLWNCPAAITPGSGALAGLSGPLGTFVHPQLANACRSLLGRMARNCSATAGHQ